MNTISPKALKKGSLVHIVCSARKVEKDFIDQATTRLEAMGLRVKHGQNLFAQDEQFAGTDAQRAADINAAIADPDCEAILCARGGYGSVRIVDQLDLEGLKKQPKWIVGYSDITALLNHIFENTGIEGIHATMPISYETNSAEALDTLETALFGKQKSFEIAPHSLDKSGAGEGYLVGGNLSVIFSLLGSNSALKGEGQILFLEDLDEYLYHVDRMMMALKRSGLLGKISGLVVGSMTDMNDNAVPFGKSAYEIIEDQMRGIDIPICFGFDSGHIDNNQAWTHGKKIRLTVKNGQPSYLEFL